MKNKFTILVATSLLFVSCLSINAQGYMATKTMIDSLKLKKFHGTASLGAKVEQTDNFKFELDASVECMVPFQRHKLRFAGDISFNFINMLDNGNRGYAYVSGDFYQFNIKSDKRYKNLMFFSAIAGAQYDFCRNLDCRLFTGFMMTFQPLRSHPHLCLEPSIGLVADFQNWNVLGGNGQQALLNMYNESPFYVQEYLGLDRRGYRWQIDPSVAFSVNFMGDWDRVAFNLYALVDQPMLHSFKKGVSEDYLPDQFKGIFNSNALPMVTVDAKIVVRLTNIFGLVFSGEFLWDGGQLPANIHDVEFEGSIVKVGARCMRYTTSLGFTVNW